MSSAQAPVPPAPPAPPTPRSPLAFGHAALAQRLIDELTESLARPPGTSTEPSLVAGVFGEWGSGKSRLLQAVDQGLPRGDGETSLTVVVPFNAWRFERDPQVLVPLLRVAQQCLRKAIEPKPGSDIQVNEAFSDNLALLGDLAQTIYQHGGRELLQAALAAQGAGAIKLPELKADASKPKPPIWERWRQQREARNKARRLHTPIDQLNSLYYDFLEHLKAVTGRNPSALALHRQRLKYRGLGPWPRLKYWVVNSWLWLGTGEKPSESDFRLNLVFLVDDLDRCLPDKAVEVLEAIKLFLEVEGCAFVLALDEEVVERGIAHRYRDYALQGKDGLTPITGAEYLEKLVHLPVRLPRPTGSAAQHFLARSRPEWFLNFADGHPNSLATLVAAITPAVPRKLHRMMDLMGMAEALGAVDVRTPQRREWLAIVCALQLFAPALYRYLRLRGARLLITLADWRADALFRDLPGLRQVLQRQVSTVDSPALLQYRLVLLRLPELCEAAMNNRSGFDLLELLARVSELHALKPLSSAQLGAVFSFTEAEAEPATEVPPAAAPEPALAPTNAETSAAPAAGPEPLPARTLPERTGPTPHVSPHVSSHVTPDATPAPASTARDTPAQIEPAAAPPAETQASPQEARLENERALVEAVASGNLELARVALSREGTALKGRWLPESFWQQLQQSGALQWVKDWIDQGAPTGPTQFLLQELLPHMSQKAAHDLIQLFGEPMRAVLKRPSWAQVAYPDAVLVLRPPPLMAQLDRLGLGTQAPENAAQWQVPRGWDCLSGEVWSSRSFDGAAAIEVGSDAGYGVFARLSVTRRATGRTAEQRFRWIGPGKFAMGSLPEEPGRQRHEGALRTCSLTQGFWIAETPCTQALWRTMADGDTKREWVDELDPFPVTNVTASEIEGFLARLGRIFDGCTPSLPSEAEWEFACRAGTRSAWYFGATPTLAQLNAGGDRRVRAGSLAPNPWGLFEMHGNVAELCRDWLGDEMREASSPVNPEGEAGEASGWHSVRGGSNQSTVEQTRSSALDRMARGDAREDVGFRFILRASTPPAQRGPA